jgi:hypothetical protein
MRDQEDFLWGGLRARLERAGKVGPATIRPVAASWTAKGARPKRKRRVAQPARVR